MLPINIYALTRIKTPALLKQMERQMSKRAYPLNIKDWEVNGIRDLSEHLYQEKKSTLHQCFYYSFQIPKLGKEFDLLRIGENSVINIELKSENVSDEVIKKQLVQNRYYLASLGKNVRSYTYISEENRLLRLTNSEKLVDAHWSMLCEDLEKQGTPYESDIEALFKEELYLISPLTDPDKFLNREYFLTSQQKDIKHHILNTLKFGKNSFQGFTGLPGTGKTLLLYDIAMQLSDKDRVSVLHFGSFPQELVHLNERLKRIDFYPCVADSKLPKLSGYEAILVDEGHQASLTMLEQLKEYSIREKKPVIFCYDVEEALSPLEQTHTISDFINGLGGFEEYRLTNRIRMNSELSSFIHCMMQPQHYHRKKAYPSVSIAYAGNQEEQDNLLSDYEKNGFVLIKNALSETCKEYDKVVMVIDNRFFYDEQGFLRAEANEAENSFPKVRNLFHGLNRAKAQIAIVVKENENVLETLLSIVQ